MERTRRKNNRADSRNARFQRVITHLLAWYERHKRKLPWRRTRDPYRIFISELMLQQTQVERVLPKYRAWMRQFPSWQHMANASTRELINHWAGLGYNRRALYARDAAKAVIAHGVPAAESAWRRLKGVGPYTAAALAEFVNHTRANVIDTNIRRVAGRAFLGLPYSHPTDDPHISQVLDRAIPIRGAHWLVPQAFMDIGSTICLPKIPRCDMCPLNQMCRARRLFLPKRIETTLQRLQRHRESTRVIELRHTDKRYPDRIYRGRILALVRTHGTMHITSLGSSIDPTYDPIADLNWVRNMVQRLIKDGLLVLDRKKRVALPNA